MVFSLNHVNAPFIIASVLIRHNFCFLLSILSIFLSIDIFYTMHRGGTFTPFCAWKKLLTCLNHLLHRNEWFVFLPKHVTVPPLHVTLAMAF